MHQYQFPITSDRLIYQPLGEKDLNNWKAFFTNNDQLAFVGITQPESPEIEAKKWIERQMGRYESTGVGALGAYRKSDGLLIGSCGLIWRDNAIDDFIYEIGYSVIPTEWGKGYASEMAQTFKGYFLQHKLGEKVISIITIDNLGSQKVALNNGMKKGEEFTFNGARCFQFYYLV